MNNKIERMVDSIEKAVYTGYIWRSDSPVPKVYTEKELAFSQEDLLSMPFVVEGQLFSQTSGKEGISYSIKNAGGRLLITRYDLAELNSGPMNDMKIMERKFYSYKIKDYSKLLFREYMRLEEDSLAQGFTSLEPGEFVFVGFEK